MSAALIVMLIWVGGNGSNSGATTIPGFVSIDLCEQATPRVHKFYDGFLLKAQIECVEFNNQGTHP
jgi:hypothetical protein